MLQTVGGDGVIETTNMAWQEHTCACGYSPFQRNVLLSLDRGRVPSMVSMRDLMQLRSRTSSLTPEAMQDVIHALHDAVHFSNGRHIFQ